MADDTASAPALAPPSPKETAPVTAEIAKSTEASALEEVTTTESTEPPADKEADSEKPAQAATDAEPEEAAEPADAEMKDTEPAPVPAGGTVEDKPAGDEPGATSAADEAAPPSASKSKDKSRRKSTGTGGAKNLKKKGSMARILHLDAKPGDFFMIKTKGYPPWPGVVADEEMLPALLIKNRPVTAMRPDGTYREDFAEGGKRVADRTYPVMYLASNEFAWIKNTDLHEIDWDTVAEKVPSKANKTLQVAHQIVTEKPTLSEFKATLLKHQEEEERKAEEAKAAAEAAAAKQAAKSEAAATPAKKSNKKKAKPVEDDGDVEMADADEEDGSETPKKPSKKRKADESVETPQRTDSVKKPKIKITTGSTPKVTNGTAGTPKSSKFKDESKPAKSKSKKPAKEAMEETEVAAPKEPELTAEEKHARKEKEVLFLRHKLQRGLLTKDQGPKEEEMKTMSDYISKLEAFPDLEVSIIRATKINKVLKAILKLDPIPKEDEFKFKPRSQTLLDQWNKLLSADEKPTGDDAKGVNGSAAGSSKKTPEPVAKAKTNGVKAEEKPKSSKEPEKKDSEEAPAKEEEKVEDTSEGKPEDPKKEPEAVAASA